MPPEPAHQVVRFGPYEANFTDGELRKHGTRLKIQSKPLSILQLLTKNQGKIVTREELRQALWQEGVFVDFEKNLGTAVNKLRAVLSDSAETPQYIETVPRRGYRFLVPVENGNGKAGPPRLALGEELPATVPPLTKSPKAMRLQQPPLKRHRPAGRPEVWFERDDCGFPWLPV